MYSVVLNLFNRLLILDVNEVFAKGLPNTTVTKTWRQI